jgi:predicted lipoprotein with Yx(FWY)xxD motif
VRRISTVIAAVAVLGLFATALAGASSGKAKLDLRKTKVGTIIVTSRGYTVYAFTKDGRNKDACAKIFACLSAWPPVKGGGLIAGHGIKASLLGTIKLKGDGTQLTYAGHALYTYTADSGPGDISNVNLLQFGGRWPAVNAAGQDVK